MASSGACSHVLMASSGDALNDTHVVVSGIHIAGIPAYWCRNVFGAA